MLRRVMRDSCDSFVLLDLDRWALGECEFRNQCNRHYESTKFCVYLLRFRLLHTRLSPLNK